MKYIFILSIGFLLFACTSGVNLKPISLAPLFNDLNSKVWMVEKVIINNKNYAPKLNLDKDVIIFYRSGKVLYQPMRTLGDLVGKKGEYTLYSEEKTISLYFPHEKWDFDIVTATEDTLVLTPRKDSDLKYKMVLVPFPEF